MTAAMGKKKIAKRSKIKSFVKVRYHNYFLLTNVLTLQQLGAVYAVLSEAPPRAHHWSLGQETGWGC